MTFGIYTSMVSDDIIPTGGGPATCGCGRVQERSGAPTCDACAVRYDVTVRTSATQIKVYAPDTVRLPTTDPNQER